MTRIRHDFTLAELAAILLFGLAAASLTLFVCSLFGPLKLGVGTGARFWEWPLWTHPVWRLRGMRLLVTALAGGGLALAGVAIQGLLRNALADPYILGISSGAALGVRAGTLLFTLGLAPLWLATRLATPLLAFAGALATCLLVYALARQRGHIHPQSLILAGIIINTFNSALTMGLTLFVDAYRVDSFARWGLGEIPDMTDPVLLLGCLVIILGGGIWLLFQGASLNALCLGEDLAASSGVRVPALRRGTFAIVSLMTAACVALAGPLSFVGLIIPHICRMLFGVDHRRLLPASFFVGAILLMIADTACRTAGPAVNLGRIPVGVITALTGGPFFIFLMRRELRRRNRM